MHANQAGQSVMQFLMALVKRGVVKGLKWLVSTLGPWLLAVVAVLGLASWVMGKFAPTNDAVANAVIPAEWKATAEAASVATVDPNKPEQKDFALPLKVLYAFRFLEPDREAATIDPHRLAALLGPTFQYVKKPISTTERWETCEDVKDEAGNPILDESGKAKQTCTGHTSTKDGEVVVLESVHQYGGVVTFTYAKKTRSFTRGSRDVTEEYWVVDKQELKQDNSRLMAAMEALNFTPPDTYLETFYTLMANAEKDPVSDASLGMPGGDQPGTAYNGTRDPGLPKDGWYWPTPGGSTITDPYGWRVHPIRRIRDFHTGVDVGAPMGSPAVAVRAGTVIRAGWAGGYGQRVEIAMDNGVVSTYNHLRRIGVRVNEVVAAGQEIGDVGSTGNSTGPHMHFELLINGASIDPQLYIRR